MHTYDQTRHTWRYDVGGFAWDNGELCELSAMRRKSDYSHFECSDGPLALDIILTNRTR